VFDTGRLAKVFRALVRVIDLAGGICGICGISFAPLKKKEKYFLWNA
jgi:hypothetical protein